MIDIQQEQMLKMPRFMYYFNGLPR